jgi:hypothetical protein
MRNIINFYLLAHAGQQAEESGAVSPATKRTVTQPVRAAETGLPLTGSRLKHGIFMTIGSNVRRPGDLVRGHIAFDLFQRLANVVVKHSVFSFH